MSTFLSRCLPIRGLVLAGCVLLLSMATSPSPGAGLWQEGRIEITDSVQRKWASADNKFTVEGKLISVDGTQIRLETSAGKNITAPLDKLCEADGQFVKAELSRMSAMGGGSPFAEESGSSPFSSADSPSGSSVDLKPDLSSLTPIELSSSNPLNPDAAHWQPSTSRAPVKRFRINARSFHASPTGWGSNSTESLFGMSFHEPFGVSLVGSGRENERSENAENKVNSWVSLVELPAGKPRGQFGLPGEFTVLGDIDPAGKFLLAFDGQRERNPRVYLLDVLPGGLRVGTSWFSLDDRGNAEEIQAARLLDGNRVLTRHRDKLIVWQTNPPEPLYSIPNDSDEWQLSRDGKFALVVDKGTRYEVNLADGSCSAAGNAGAGDRDTAVGPGTPEPGGTRLATLEGSVLTLRSDSGEVLDSFFVPVFWPQSKLAWIDAQTIEVRTHHQTWYIDLPNRIALLEVVEHGTPSPANAPWLIDLDRDSDGGDVFVTQAKPAAPGSAGPDLSKLRKQLPETGDGLLVLKPGDSVRITSELLADNRGGPDPEQTIRKLLEKRGVNISDDATDEIKLVSATRSETMEYRNFGRPAFGPGGTETVTVRISTCSVSLVRDGKVLWSKGSSSGPGFMLQVQEGESTQQAADRQSGDTAHFWQSLTLPEKVAAHPNGSAWFRANRSGGQIEFLPR